MNVVLVQPEVPPNTGNIARLCAAVGMTLHLVGPLGFRLTDSRVRRAGLDYWDYVDIKRHSSLDTFLESIPDSELFFFSKYAADSYTRARYQEEGYLVFGSETRGLPEAVRQRYSNRLWTIPMFHPSVRSLNLANAVSIVCYEALRQLGRV
ncbi:MAG: tRNA (cytidine(34)-2'-O)-methyltransferase [Acidobacteria bacterium]|nr:MAG: tRNA (cytidine(34)-2'-O)-methyltransferase [Acidobacteriota bacterium]